MPFANVSSVRLHYQVLGNQGPWVALASGARRGMAEVRELGGLVADRGFQVLLHDRRNTGQSSLSLDGEGSVYTIAGTTGEASTRWSGFRFEGDAHRAYIRRSRT